MPVVPANFTRPGGMAGDGAWATVSETKGVSGAARKDSVDVVDMLTVPYTETPGDGPYICTFPGHWQAMQGVLRVR